MKMIEKLIRHCCTDSNGDPLLVLEHRHIFITRGMAGKSQHLGAVRAKLADGEPVRRVDHRTFEVIATGKLLAHDPSQCDCAPASSFANSRTGSTPAAVKVDVRRCPRGTLRP